MKSGITYRELSSLLYDNGKSLDLFLKDMDSFLKSIGYERIGRKTEDFLSGVETTVYRRRDEIINIIISNGENYLRIESINPKGNSLNLDDIDTLFNMVLTLEKENMVKYILNNLQEYLAYNYLFVDWMVKLAISYYMLIA